MKILLLTHSFNSLTQRVYAELESVGHELSVEFDINDSVTCEAVEQFQPDLIIAPFLKRAIPASIWQNHLCWIIHPGIIGDRGPSSLDWAILNGEKAWGVTVLQANDVMDGGDIWASENFAMRDASKSSLYRHELTNAAMAALFSALAKLENGEKPMPLADFQEQSSEALGQWRCQMRQSDRSINWQTDSAAQIVRKINTADGTPGVLTEIMGQSVYVFNASVADNLTSTCLPGEVAAIQGQAMAIKCADSAVWITHLKQKPDEHTPRTLKLPATQVISLSKSKVADLQKLIIDFAKPSHCQEIWYEIRHDTGYLHFNFYNGAMSTSQCQQLLNAYKELAQKNVNTIVLMGGENFWSNGIHLNTIEAAELSGASAADESWANINAMNDLCQAIIETTTKITIAAMRGNAGAGGVFFALACDYVFAKGSLILNPHYKSMGNLYGSEYWTYLLPKRVGSERSQSIMQNRLPLTAKQAKACGLVDELFADECFNQELHQKLVVIHAAHPELIHAKVQQRVQDESEKPLAQYRAEELANMKLNFYGFDPSYHVARYHFVYKLDKARTPPYLAKHRNINR